MVEFGTSTSYFSFIFVIIPFIFYVFAIYVGVQFLTYLKRKERFQQEVKDQLQELSSLLKREML